MLGESVMKSSPLLCLCVWACVLDGGFGQLIYVDVFWGASVPVLWGFQGGTSARQPESLGSISADSPQTENSNLGWRSAGGGLALWLSRGPKIERNVLLWQRVWLMTPGYWQICFKKFSVVLLCLWKVRSSHTDTHTHMHAQTDRQCGQVWVSYRQDGESGCVKRTHLYFSGG